MYQKIMIPLDGSALAECVLPHAEAFMKGGLVKTAVFIVVLEPLPITLYDASVTFDVVTPMGTFPTSGHKDIIFPNMEYWEKKGTERKSSANVYLDKITGRFNQYGAEIQCEVLEGRVAETLAGYAEDNKVDLILIATHGRSGVGRWLMGSVADRVLRYSQVPVLMVRAPGCATAINT